MSMNPIEKWHKIVEQFNKNKKSKESDIQILREDIFSQVFGYSKILGFLDAQKTYHIGSSGSLKPDIILKKSNVPVCAVELKQESIVLNDKIETQLFSYLKQTKIDTGIIIADKIYIYAYEYQKNDSEQSRIEIVFDKDNPDGEFFINFLNIDSFNSKAIAEYINEKINHLNNVKKIKDNLSKGFVLEALDSYLGHQYTKDEIQEALNSIEIIINDKKKINAIKLISEGQTQEKVLTSDKKTEKKIELRFDADILIKGGKASSNYLRKVLIESNYINDKVMTTLAKINKDTNKKNKRYWANPPIDYIKCEWLLVLNDNVNRILHIFRIPANSLKKEEVKTRIRDGKILLDLEIVHQDEEYVCISSKIQFNRWLVEKINY